MFRKVSLKEMNEILRSNSYRVRDDLKFSPHDDGIYYELADGKILLDPVLSKNGLLYDDYAAFRKAFGMDEDQVQHVLAGLNFSNNISAQDVASAKSVIAEVTGLNPTKLDGSFESLKYIDSQISKAGLTAPEFKERLFKPLIIYIGNVIVQQKGGKWKFFYDDECKLWEPHILLPDGRTINVFNSLSDMILEEFETLSVYDVANMQLHSL